MPSVLVTGAGGFIGRPACAALQRRGFNVIGSGRSLAPSGWTGERWITGDLLSEEGPRQIVAEARADTLLHLAWDTTPRLYWNSAANLDWTVASLKLFKDFVAAGGRRAVLSGTCAEYEWSDHYPLSETTTPCRPGTLYGHAKLSLAQLLSARAEHSGLSFAHARLFYLFGRGERPERFVPQIVIPLLTGKEARCQHGAAIRDWMSADDAGDALAALVASKVCGTVNIASGTGRELGAVARMLAVELGTVHQLLIGSTLPASEPRRIVADVCRLRNVVGWAGPEPIEQRLHETVEWWRQNMEVHGRR